MNLAFLKNLQLHTYHPTESISPQPLTHDQSVFYLQHQTFHFIKLPFLLSLLSLTELHLAETCFPKQKDAGR